MAAWTFSALLCLGWCWPDHFTPWPAFHNEVPVFLAVILGMGLTLWRAQNRSFDLSAGSWLALMLVGVAGLQWLTDLLTYHGDLVLVALYMIGAGLAWELGRSWAGRSESRLFTAIDTLALAFVSGATLSSLVAFIQWVEQEASWMPWVMPAAHTNRAIANLAQPNQLSTLLLMGIIATALLYERVRMSGVLALFFIVIHTLILVLTQSRTGMVIAFALIAISPWITKKSHRLHWWMVLIWAIAFFLLVSIYQELGQQTSKAALGTQQVMQVGLRPLMWQQFGAALMESPLWGFGWLQTVRAQQIGALTVPGLEQAVYTHNVFLDLAIWMGLPLFLFVLILIAYWVWQRRKGFKNLRVRWCIVWL
ncbi:MAG: O-antigen ligase family protein, partial [Curvibacter sp.]